MKIIFLLFFLFSFIGLKAQDKLYLKNGDSLNVQILNRSNKKIKYIIDDSNADLITANTYLIELYEIDRIGYKDGRMEKILLRKKNSFLNRELSESNNIISLAIPFTNYGYHHYNLYTKINWNCCYEFVTDIGIYYERIINNLSRKKSIEISLTSYQDFGIAYKLYNKNIKAIRSNITSINYFGPVIDFDFNNFYGYGIKDIHTEISLGGIYGYYFDFDGFPIGLKLELKLAHGLLNNKNLYAIIYFKPTINF